MRVGRAAGKGQLARRRGRGILFWGAVAAALSCLGAALALADDDFEEAPIQYSAGQPADAVARLQQQLDRGQTTLKRDPVRGYLPAVLQQLKVPVSSQMLVFSKTSFQRDLISPQTPRALYFNDRTYVGWVPGGLIEAAAVDPQLGAVFYVMDPAQPKPRFVRQTHECLSCHGSTLTGGVPGLAMRSVFADGTGLPHLAAGTFVTTDQSPLKERWGGWYVTGTHGGQRHMGNLITHSEAQAENADLGVGANVTNLRKRFDTTPYLSAHSDIVALMVIEHQARVQNLIIRANHETRKGLRFEEALKKELGKREDQHLDSTLSRIKSVGEPLVKAMLLVKEAPLTAPIAGTSSFTRDFSGEGPRDKQGRSLRSLDLKTRLFQFPCSYMIYSEAFDGLPQPAKQYVYGRLWEVLSGQDKSSDFEHLTATDRKAILEILLETKPDFAAWKAGNGK
jgi:hypothetical protein